MWNRLSKRTQFWLFLGLLAVSLYSAYSVWIFYMKATSTGLPSPMTRFNSDHFGISMEYPQAWTAYELLHGNHGDQQAIAYFSYSAPVTRIVVLVARMPSQQPSAQQIADWGLARLETHFSNINVLATTNLDDTTLRREYTKVSLTPIGRFTDKCMDWYMIVDDTGYALSFCAQENYWPKVESTFEMMAKSFEAQ
jgi:hypothetical protein